MDEVAAVAAMESGDTADEGDVAVEDKGELFEMEAEDPWRPVAEAIGSGAEIMAPPP